MPLDSDLIFDSCLIQSALASGAVSHAMTAVHSCRIIHTGPLPTTCSTPLRASPSAKWIHSRRAQVRGDGAVATKSFGWEIVAALTPVRRLPHQMKILDDLK
jgi:hypothetical protein